MAGNIHRKVRRRTKFCVEVGGKTTCFPSKIEALAVLKATRGGCARVSMYTEIGSKGTRYKFDGVKRRKRSR